MSLTETLFRNRHAVWAATLAAALFGVVAYFALPMQLFPDTNPPLVNVITAYPGAGAEDVADELSRPIEDEIASLEGIAKVRSTSQDNLSLVTAEFRYGIDADMAAVDVQDAIARIRGSIPGEIEEPRVLTFSSGDRPIYSLGVRATDLAHARKIAEDVLAPRLQRIPGVAAVDVFGGSVPAVLVEVQRTKLEAQHVSIDALARALREQNANVPAGRLRTEVTQDMLRVESRSMSLEQLRKVSLPTSGGSRIALGDLAGVRLGALDDDARFAIDGKAAIALQVFKTDEANTVEVVDLLDDAVNELRKEHAGLELIQGEESASFTATVVGNLMDNVFEALGLAAIIIFLFLRKSRTAMVAVVSMPLSYGITFALMKALGVELNMVTLSAIILAVGMVVDASVVVMENIARHHDELGLTPQDAAIRGTDEIRLAVLAGAATTLVVLVPLLFLYGFIGKTFGPLALTLILAFLSSVVVALVLVPVLTVYTLGDSRLDRIGVLVTRPFTWLMDRLRGGYVGLLRRALRWRFATLLLGLSSAAVGAVGIMRAGMEVLPKMDGGSFYVALETPPGSSIDGTAQVVGQVEELLRKESEVVLVQSQIGYERGMRSFPAGGVQGPTSGFITVTLTPRTERSEDLWSIEARVRDGIDRIAGIHNVNVRELGNTAKSTTSAPILVRISGPDALVLDGIAGDVEQRLRAVPGIVAPARSWRVDQQRVRVRVDELRAGQLGLSSRQVARILALGSDGQSGGKYYGVEGTPVPIWVRYDRTNQRSPEDLLSYPVQVPGRDPVPLRLLADVDEIRGQGLVTREDFANTIEVSAFHQGKALSFVIADAEDAISDVLLPRGYQVTMTGEKSDMSEAKREIGGALGIAVIAVYLILVAQLRSFLHPISVLAAVPLSLGGVAAALTIAQKPVSMPVLIGLVLLVGIVVNNSIILIDFIRSRREAGDARDDAILGAVDTRFRPIMMTSLSTIVGMIPLAAEWALGAERFSPLAVAVLGGMTAATFLTMIVVPVFYHVLDDLASAVQTLSVKLGISKRPNPSGAAS
jgi:multidrug efflux pump subunit AcrB